MNRYNDEAYQRLLTKQAVDRKMFRLRALDEMLAGFREELGIEPFTPAPKKEKYEPSTPTNPTRGTKNPNRQQN